MIPSLFLNINHHLIDGYLVQDNTPAQGFISWSDLHITYKGITYNIQDGYTNYKYAWWDYDYPNNLVVGDTLPTLTDDDVLLFFNKNGIHMTIPKATVIDGGLIVSESIMTNAIAANAITSEKIAAGAVTASEIAANAIQSMHIAAGAITADKIAANAIGASAIAAGVITGDKLVADTITAREIAPRTITANEIATNTITAASGVIADAAITTAKIADGAITNTKIANASIDNAKIANVDASKITTGTLDANRIGAGSITADKILVGNFTNLVENGGFELDSAGWSLPTGASIDTTSPHTGNKCLKITGGGTIRDALNNTNLIEVKEGETYYLEGWYKCDTGTNGTGYVLGLFVYDKNKSIISYQGLGSTTTITTTWTKKTATYTIPTGACYIRPWLSVRSDCTTGAWYFDDFVVRRTVEGSLVINGTLDASKVNVINLNASNITTGTLSADRIQGGTLALGGASNANGILKIKDSSGNDVVVGDNTGIEVSHSDVGTKTRQSADGFKIIRLSDDETIGDFSLDTNNDSKLNIGSINAKKIYSPNIITILPSTVTYYVNGDTGNDNNPGTSSQPFKSIYKALSKIDKFIPYGTTAYIYVSGTCNSEPNGLVVIDGYMGGGSLQIIGDRNGTLNGAMKLYNNTCFISLDGGRTSYNSGRGFYVRTQSNSGYNTPIDVLRCSDVYIRGISMYGQGLPTWCAGVYFGGAKGYIELCDISNTYVAVSVDYESQVLYYDCIGSNNGYSILVNHGSYCGINSNGGNVSIAQYSNSDVWVGNGSTLVKNATFTQYASQINPPATQTYTKTYTATATKSWRDSGYGWRSDNNYIYQGNYGYGTHRGFAYFDWQTIRNDLAGATINSVSIYLQRRNSGGSSAAQNIHIYTHNYGSYTEGYALGTDLGIVGSLAWGEGKWFNVSTTLGTMLRDGTAKGFMIYNGTDPYVICETNAQMSITYTK
ncbi:carbohydrate binding domain-containing protein [Fonticella tunisiensis]|uniref:Carbohydrate binding protein n=1 Tax=Fonticella tunisiensis TaxID=1096341 RepID=A0A4R7KTS6_9CLOT|nr:carbohydrate binding domain-containing protein [Fonticella tunisiensis]TDT63433.1 carbohydrate binding protein [Fonticella tunisiensis]